MTSGTGLNASFCPDTVLTPADKEVSESDSDSDSDLEELLGLASPLRLFTNPLTVGFCEALFLVECARAF